MQYTVLIYHGVDTQDQFDEFREIILPVYNIAAMRTSHIFFVDSTWPTDSGRTIFFVCDATTLLGIAGCLEQVSTGKEYISIHCPKDAITLKLTDGFYDSLSELVEALERP